MTLCHNPFCYDALVLSCVINEHIPLFTAVAFTAPLQHNILSQAQMFYLAFIFLVMLYCYQPLY